jgi:hypothetical protein
MPSALALPSVALVSVIVFAAFLSAMKPPQVAPVLLPPFLLFYHYECM